MNRPAWLEPIASGMTKITGADISAFLPPADHSGRVGAVLMLLGEGPEGPDLLLTERAHTMRSHPGQISFPGGSVDASDADPIAAALREAQEETGLYPASVDVLGTLPQLWLPPSNFAVTTVVGWWTQRTPLSVQDPAEVERVLQVPIAELLDPTYRITVRHPSGYQSAGWWIGPDKNLILWGFTAGVINKLFDYVGMTRPWDPAEVVELPGYMLGQD